MRWSGVAKTFVEGGGKQGVKSPYEERGYLVLVGTMITRRFPRFAVSALLLAAVGCGGDVGPEIRPGFLTASLVSPNGSEGAALISIVGVGLGDVESAAGRVFTFSLGDTTRILLVLDTPGDLRFRISVPDVDKPPVGTVLQVADGENAIRPDLSEYRVRFSQ